MLTTFFYINAYINMYLLDNVCYFDPEFEIKAGLEKTYSRN